MVGTLPGVLAATCAKLGGGICVSLATAILAHGYVAIFVLMALEAASFPIPSEVVLPLVGYLGALGYVSVPGGFAAAMLGSVVGMSADYAVAYYLGKEVVYKHMHVFHIKRRTVDAFDAWFASNGRFTVFIARLIPLVRGLINFPAGFAGMSLRDFFLYSLLGAAIWTALLMGVGFYAQSLAMNVYYLMVGMALFFVVLYAMYRFMMKRILRELKK
jgi:membrane protein DedA with SNARE-associated domain